MNLFADEGPRIVGFHFWVVFHARLNCATVFAVLARTIVLDCMNFDSERILHELRLHEAYSLFWEYCLGFRFVAWCYFEAIDYLVCYSGFRFLVFHSEVLHFAVFHSLEYNWVFRYVVQCLEALCYAVLHVGWSYEESFVVRFRVVKHEGLWCGLAGAR